MAGRSVGCRSGAAMNNRPVIALIAGRVSLDSFGEEEQYGLWAAIAVLRAVLERGGRTLIGAESSYVIPLLMAAAEYQEPRRVETGEEAAPSPVILGPLLSVDSVDDELLHRRTGRSEAPKGLTLLEEFEGSGLVERGWIRSDNIRGAAEIFQEQLSDHQPLGIVAVGSGTRTEPLLVAAEIYRQQESQRQVRLFRLLAAGDRNSQSSWEAIDGRWSKVRMPPPMLDGEIIGEQTDGTSWNEQLVALARRAAEEASMVLAIDRAVGSIITEPFEAR
jgi:hypothetical protein